ncbi:DNA glycosylase AlkZ-like family protein [Thermomonospora cellulosilytica]|uniref:Winged helix DNA-binding domain-containing protein n=1 Tax=Thermomonospora cellulosilytica TaxID=1411118 RepID=A0A7W3MZH7_9ACTN|nr:crosslink repair DNA glycosylase YcaQ family protein [Thermomonospora cellulosilytica]MBA9004751.1 hypothetical protein [Thermomonospora cellulosilytica]
MIEVDRSRVLAYRLAEHGLTDETADGRNALDLGFQDTPPGTAVVGTVARRWSPPADSTAVIWSVRGAPHLHRRSDLAALAGALWPLSDADATARMRSAQLKEVAPRGIEAFAMAAQAMRDVVTGPMTKGQISRAVSDALPPEFSYYCPTCAAEHVSGQLFQQVGIFAGVRLLPGGRTTMLGPVEEVPAVPDKAHGTDGLIRAYLRLLGPATKADVARFFGTTATALGPAWPDGLAEVRVEGRTRLLPADRVDALTAAAPPRGVRLLSAYDPYLQTGDRDLLVPDKARQKEVWRTLGRPGVLLADGEIAGTWRARTAGRRLEVTITPYTEPGERIRGDADAEAARLAEARGAADVRVMWANG